MTPDTPGVSLGALISCPSENVCSTSVPQQRTDFGPRKPSGHPDDDTPPSAPARPRIKGHGKVRVARDSDLATLSPITSQDEACGSSVVPRHLLPVLRS